MKKNELIDILSNIQGNPDIMLWNGLVGDFMEISRVVESSLVKPSLNHYQNMIEMEECIDLKDRHHKLTEESVKQIKIDYRKHIKWQLNEYISQEDIKEGRYKEKIILAIDAKIKGETYYDRIGPVSY